MDTVELRRHVIRYEETRTSTEERMQYSTAYSVRVDGSRLGVERHEYEGTGRAARIVSMAETSGRKEIPGSCVQTADHMTRGPRLVVFLS